MSSLTDRPDDSSIGGRALSLGQVSEAATALAGTRVPKQLSDIRGVSRISPGANTVVLHALGGPAGRQREGAASAAQEILTKG